jgi:outer membrane receptor protein involved in Fe transport
MKAVISDLLTIEPHLGLNYQDIRPTVNTTRGMHGDWHGREASCNAAADVHIRYHPLEMLLGGSVQGVYSKTEGGYHEILTDTVLPSDTLFSIAAVNGALSYKPRDSYLLFLSAGRFSNQPSLRERYGARGAHIPNPDLLPEQGIAAECGGKIYFSRWFAEAAAFYNRTENTIMTLHHGTLTKSVNAEGARVYGLELSLTATPFDWFGLDSRATFQRTENLTRQNNYYGRRLPDEPDIALFHSLRLGPVAGFSLVYGADISSFYFHDPANVSLRVPRKNADGTGDYWRDFHNAKLTWSPGKHLSISASLNKITNDYLTQQESIATDEDTYSLIRYPTNHWCVSLMYSF